MQQLGSYWADFRDFFLSRTFVKICQENSGLVEIGQKRVAFYMKVQVDLTVFRRIRHEMREQPS